MSTVFYPSIHTTIPLNAMELRQQLGEVLERVHYRYDQFQIVRKDKPMARIVNEQYIQAIEYLVQDNPALAETLEIMLDKEFANALTEDVKPEAYLPLEAALKD